MKKSIGYILIFYSIFLGAMLNYQTENLEYKVAISFISLLVGIYLLIKTQ